MRSGWAALVVCCDGETGGAVWPSLFDVAAAAPAATVFKNPRRPVPVSWLMRLLGSSYSNPCETPANKFVGVSGASSLTLCVHLTPSKHVKSKISDCKF
jgi:hypothetical protein